MILTDIFNDELKEAFILHIPHSSIEVPEKHTYTNEETLQEQISLLTDWATDIIFKVDYLDTLVCPFSRVFCDVERFENDELEKVGWGFYYTHTDSGVEFRSVSDKDKVFTDYYIPYHKQLSRLARQKEERFGMCFLVDCHSFPDAPFIRDTDKEERPDICVGVNSTTPKFMELFFKLFFESKGFSVKINSPYKGALIPFGCQHTHSIMIEINRKLYMSGGVILNERVAYLNSIISSLFSEMFVGVK